MMPHQRRGPKDWRPGMKAGIVKDPASSPITPTEYRLEFVRNVQKMGDVPPDPDFESNAGRALTHGDRLQHWTFMELKGGEPTLEGAGDMLWWPKQRRAGIIYWPDYEDLNRPQWTDAVNPLDALSRWVYGEMTDEDDGGGPQ